jgi:hypothetical protein
MPASCVNTSYANILCQLMTTGGIHTTSALEQQLGIDFALLPLDSTHFLHGFGQSCSDSRLTVNRWMLPVENLDREGVELDFS